MCVVAGSRLRACVSVSLLGRARARHPRHQRAALRAAVGVCVGVGVGVGDREKERERERERPESTPHGPRSGPWRARPRSCRGPSTGAAARAGPVCTSVSGGFCPPGPRFVSDSAGPRGPARQTGSRPGAELAGPGARSGSAAGGRRLLVQQTVAPPAARLTLQPGRALRRHRPIRRRRDRSHASEVSRSATGTE